MSEFQDFVMAMTSYVRNTDGEKIDARPQMSSKLALQPELLLHMQGSDVAAIFSGTISVNNRLSLLFTSELQGRQLAKVIRLQNKQLPLSSNDQQVMKMLQELLKSSKGRLLYRDIVLILKQAKEDKDFQHLLAHDSQETSEDCIPTVREFDGESQNDQPANDNNDDEQPEVFHE